MPTAESEEIQRLKEEITRLEKEIDKADEYRKASIEVIAEILKERDAIMKDRNGKQYFEDMMTQQAYREMNARIIRGNQNVKRI